MLDGWTLWDLLPRRREKTPAPAPRQVIAPARMAPAPPVTAPARTPASVLSMQDRYDAMTRELLAEHGVRVRRWRTAMSGIAWEVYYRDGRTSRLIEAPRPRGPMSAAIFCHEIGHHAIGFSTYKPRCLEEYHAWAWALAEMDRRGLNITPRVIARRDESLRYAVAKARRRGIKALPAELAPFL